MSDAFDSDVLIYAANDVPIAPRIQALIETAPHAIGSLLLLPETLSKPLRQENTREEEAVARLLVRLDLKPVDAEVADAATVFAAKYRLHAADAIHLATAVVWGAERFHTNNRKHFGQHITEVEVVWPER